MRGEWILSDLMDFHVGEGSCIQSIASCNNKKCNYGFVPHISIFFLLSSRFTTTLIYSYTYTHHVTAATAT